jgi:zinc protease
MTSRPGHVVSRAALALVSLAVLSTGAFAAEERIGNRLFLVRDKPGTSTHFHMIVNAGCTDEANGQCRGLAHYLEHLVLVGRNPEHKDAAVRFFPDGYTNGWTNQRATAYLHTIPPRENGPKAELETLFNFYAARLKDFNISDEDALRERNVVRQEHDWRVASRPLSRFSRTLDRALLPDHPSGQWTIGTKEDIESFTLDEAKAFHRSWYVINNVFFVVRGDIEPAALKDIADRTLAGLNPQTLPPRAILRPPQLVIERKEFREEDAAVRRTTVIVRKLVRVEEPDVIAARAARGVIGSFLGSRLPGSPHDVLVERDKVAGAVSISTERIAPRILKINLAADVAPDSTPERVIAALEAYVDALARTGIPDQTIERIKTRYVEGRAIADREPAQVHSRLINWLASRSPYDGLAQWPARLTAVTPADVATVLRGMSGEGRVVTGVLAPTKAEAGP